MIKVPHLKKRITSPRWCRRPSATVGVVALWAVLMGPLLFWGLPTARHDDLLFGGAPAWKAEEYGIESALEQLKTRAGGADTDLNPLVNRDRIVDLTADDAARAEILRRYRLYSRQPDEMIILRALQRMDPRRLDFDPQLYQYGGGYIYLVAAAIAAGGLLQLIELTSDAGVYLEHPESLAGFYVAARVVSLVFGALTLVAVSKLARRAGGRLAGWLALLCTAASPVFITAVVEAKPHLPSACMVLWATLSALDYRAHGRLRDALRMGWQAGCAMALVLTGLVAALLWPALLLARPPARRGGLMAHVGLAFGLALVVYVFLNPYLAYNLAFDRAALASNISNSTAMYQDQIRQAAAGALRVAMLLVEGAGAGVPLVGLLGLVALLRRYRAATALAAGTGLAMLVMCILLGAGKPAEFARFLILPVLLLCVATGWLLAAWARRRLLVGALATVFVLGLMRTDAYVRALAVDARGTADSRRLAGKFLADHVAPGDTIGLLQEPAPYAVPPLDFAHRHILLLPPTMPRNVDPARLPCWMVFTADDAQRHADAWWHAHYELVDRFPSASAPPARITWANKPVFIYRRAR